jgi:hypothetical protein
MPVALLPFWVEQLRDVPQGSSSKKKEILAYAEHVTRTVVYAPMLLQAEPNLLRY